MISEPASPPTDQRARISAGLPARLARYFKAQVADWYDECRQLSSWEDEHLLDDSAPEKLAEHSRLLDQLERIGRWLLHATKSPDFSDPDSAQLVIATLQDLKDRRAMWHGHSLTTEQKTEILRDCFDEP